MIDEITSGSDILDLIIAAVGPIDPAANPLVYRTDAGANVFRPGDWPAQDGQYPLLKARITSEFKQSLSRSGAPEFNVTTTVRVEAQVSAPAAVGDAGAAAAEAALWRLARQVEVAVIGSYPLTQLIQRIASVSTQLAYSSDGETHLSGAQIDLAIEWFAGPDCFAPPPYDDLTSAQVTIPNYPPLGFTADLNP